MAAKAMVILDANAVIPHFELGSAALRALLERARRARCDVTIPEVVVREVVAKRTTLLGKLLAQFADPMHREIGLAAPVSKPGASAQEYEKAFRKRLANDGISVLPLLASHDATIARAIAKVPPFNDGAKGYRDALVWEAVLEAAADAKRSIILVSADEGFGPPADGQVKRAKDAPAPSNAPRATGDDLPWHSALERELIELGADDRVRRVRTLRDALVLLPAAPPPPERPADEDVVALVEGAAEKMSEGIKVDEIDVDGLQVTDVHAETYDEPTVTEVEFEEIVGDDELTFTARVRLACSFLGFAHKWEAQAHRGRVRIVDPDWNEWVAQVSFSGEADLEVVVVLEHDDDLEQWDVREVEVADVVEVRVSGPRPDDDDDAQ